MSNTHTPEQEALRFLIVDDSRAIQAITRRVVERCGYPKIQIETAANGELALEVLKNFSPHLIITDWHMPKMSGLELLQTIRQLNLSDAHVGLVTTETSKSMLDEACRNGARFVINKPFKNDELIQALLDAVPLDTLEKAPPTPAKAEKADKTGGTLVVTEECQRLIQTTMNGIPFRLLEQAPLAAKTLTAKNLIGLYGGKNKPVTALLVLDMNAVCILGGGASRQQPAAVKEAMQQGQATEGMMKQANQFMQSAAARLHIPSEPETIVLSRTSIVPREFQKLEELLVRQSGRADYRISVPGYGDGYFTFLAV